MVVDSQISFLGYPLHKSLALGLRFSLYLPRLMMPPSYAGSCAQALQPDTRRSICWLAGSSSGMEVEAAVRNGCSIIPHAQSSPTRLGHLARGNKNDTRVYYTGDVTLQNYAWLRKS